MLDLNFKLGILVINESIKQMTGAVIASSLFVIASEAKQSPSQTMQKGSEIATATTSPRDDAL
ncbi:hypothetical protein TH606_09710 [Thermodesulfatator autotrophicus]|uniref:Uncharacterized protein n=1 Tax=Thermodesulfatator autotrophicus TaxID=1795632 RepID=A0A177E6T8_9BACT|nr:hypothetical protein TH606_09710 [Thermodesulfatator autotrophicus]